MARSARPQEPSTSVDLFDRARFTAGPPHELFRRFREEQPVAFLPEPDGPGFWGVFRYDDVVEVSRHPQRFASSPSVFVQDPEDATVTQELLINQDPPRHTKLRKLVNRGFTPRQISALEPHVRDIVRGLLDRAAAMARSTSSTTWPSSCRSRSSPRWWVSRPTTGTRCSRGPSA